jgi:hypothetical protein
MIGAVHAPGPAERRVPQAARGAGGLFLLLLAGCGLFTPATPDPPVSDTGNPLPILTVDPESALVSWERGVELKDINLYMHAFSDSQVSTDVAFHAFFDPQDLLDFASGGTPPPADWRNSQEATFAPQFFGLRPVSYVVYLTPDPNRPDLFLDPDSDVIYYRRYRIWAQADPVGVGLVDLRLKRVGVSGEWKIVQWVDRRDTTATVVRTYGRRRLDSL